MMLPLRVLDHLVAADVIGVLEADLLAGREAEEFLGRVLAEVVLLDIDLARKGQLARAGGGVLGVVLGVDLLHLPSRIVGDDDFQRPQHGHHPPGRSVQVFAQAVLEQGHVDHALALGHADSLGEVADGLRA